MQDIVNLLSLAPFPNFYEWIQQTDRLMLPRIRIRFSSERTVPTVLHNR